MDCDFDGSKLILAHEIYFSRPFKIHLLPRTDVVVTVSSYMKAWTGGSCTPYFISGPQHSTFADLTTMFMARVKRMTEMVLAVRIPSLSPCQSNVMDPEVTLLLKMLYSSKMRLVISHCLWRITSISLWGMEPWALARSPLTCFVSVRSCVTAPYVPGSQASQRVHPSAQKCQFNYSSGETQSSFWDRILKNILPLMLSSEMVQNCMTPLAHFYWLATPTFFQNTLRSFHRWWRSFGQHLYTLNGIPLGQGSQADLAASTSWISFQLGSFRLNSEDGGFGLIRLSESLRVLC